MDEESSCFVNGDLRYSCAHCGNIYNRRWNLLRHIKEQHDTTAQVHQCPVDGCDFNSKRYSTVKRHVMDKHRETNLFPPPVSRKRELPSQISDRINMYRDQVLGVRSFSSNYDVVNVNSDGDSNSNHTAQIDTKIAIIETPSAFDKALVNLSSICGENSAETSSTNQTYPSETKIDVNENKRRLVSAVDQLSSSTGYRIAILAVDGRDCANSIAYQCESQCNMSEFLHTFNEMAEKNRVETITEDNVDETNSPHKEDSHKDIAQSANASSAASDSSDWSECDKVKDDSSLAWIQGPNNKWLAVPVLAVSKERPNGLVCQNTAANCNEWNQVLSNDSSPDTDRASGSSELSVNSTSSKALDQNQLFKELTREFEPLFQA